MQREFGPDSGNTAGIQREFSGNFAREGQSCQNAILDEETAFTDNNGGFASEDKFWGPSGVSARSGSLNMGKLSGPCGETSIAVEDAVQNRGRGCG